MPEWLQTLLTLLGAGGAGYGLDKLNAKDAIQPREAVEMAKEPYTNMKKWLGGAVAGNNPITQQPYAASHPLQQARTTLQNRMGGGAQPPAPFNPYQQQGQMTANPQYGNPMMELLKKLTMATQGGARNTPVQQQTMPFAQQSLANRFTPRPMVR